MVLWFALFFCFSLQCVVERVIIVIIYETSIESSDLLSVHAHKYDGSMDIFCCGYVICMYNVSAALCVHQSISSEW